MKKLIFSVLALSIIVFSCQKENIEPKITPDNSKVVNVETNEIQPSETIVDNSTVKEMLLNEINFQTQDYLKENSIDINQEAKVPKWLKVLGADLKGALAGAATGLGIAVGTGIDPGAGATGGAFVGGASASIDAEASVIIDNNGLSGVIYNQNNAFEAVGKSHYLLLDEAINGSPNWYSNSVIDYNLFIDRAYEMLKIKNLNCDVSKNCISPSEYKNIVQSVLNDNSNIKNYANNLNFSNVVKIILHDYFQVMLWMKNYNSYYFANYSILVEDLISQSNLQNNDKIVLLIEMSTARVGFQYWK